MNFKVTFFGVEPSIIFPPEGEHRPKLMYFYSKKLAASISSRKNDDVFYMENAVRELGATQLAVVIIPPREPSHAFAALKFAHQYIGRNIVCCAQTEPEGELKTFIEDHRLPKAIGKFDSNKFQGNNGLYSALRQIKFPLAESSSENEAKMGTLDKNNNILKIEDMTIPLEPRKIKLLSLLAGGEICGNDYLRRQLKSHADPMPLITLKIHISKLLKKLDAKEFPRFIQNFWGIGYRLTGLNLTMKSTPEPITPVESRQSVTNLSALTQV